MYSANPQAVCYDYGMGRAADIGNIIAIFGLAGSTLLGALMLLHQDWVGPIADGRRSFAWSASLLVFCSSFGRAKRQNPPIRSSPHS